MTQTSITTMLKALKSRAGISQIKLSKMSGVSQSQISKIQNGKKVATYDFGKLVEQLYEEKVAQPDNTVVQQAEAS